MLRSLLSLLLVAVYAPLAAQSITAYLLQLHGAGCDDQSGMLVVQAFGGGGNYTYLWNNGSTNDTLSGVGAGVHSVTVHSGSDSAVVSWEMPAFGIDTVIVHHVCGGSLGGPGWIDLDDIHAQYPLQFAWYDGGGNLLPETTALLASSVPDTFHYAMTDADGCVDSGTVVMSASDPVLEVFTTDSALCYGQSALMWYTPGFTLYDNWGNLYNSSTDTIYYVDQMGSTNMYPTVGVDALGCEAEVSNDPFVYQQSHPDPIIVYDHVDTLSTTFMIDTTASSYYTFIWRLNGQVIDSSAYGYLPIDTSGLYSVSIINQYGCSVHGTILVTMGNTGLQEEQFMELYIGPNPACAGIPWTVVFPETSGAVPYRITDAAGRLVASGGLHAGPNAIGGALPAGTYVLQVSHRSHRLVRTH